ncbi:hypothetical protein HJC23_003557 [Cyclotella cryptica]|uniref:Glycosyl transferase CAP10 domain-containing protein n=1 Tax=Cyclotella cryptica TaxID=29204 RepID=A0ABD3PI76_9STRA|eukprot:CCRYP_014203-RA/>CCRYP_014203-RA protein AED:0.02 eAED:0.02 QI:0/-1/0/1/-1/1/1/0/586
MMVSLLAAVIWGIAACILVTINCSTYSNFSSSSLIELRQSERRLESHGLSRQTSTTHNNTNAEGQGQRALFPKLSGFSDPKSTNSRTTPPIDRTDVSLDPNQTKAPDSVMAKYSLYKVLLTIPAFRRELYLLYYHPIKDEFHVYINEQKDGWVAALKNRIYQIMPMLAYALRNHFPDRFNGESDFILLASSGDEPKLDCSCFDKVTRSQHPICRNEDFAPILQFGAVFQDGEILPSLVTMPLWHHLPCLRQWQQTNTICETYKKRTLAAGVVGGEEAIKSRVGGVSIAAPPLEQVWDSLIPQVIWRGSDFGFIWCIHPLLRLIDFETDIAKRISLSQCRNNARGILQCLLQLWEILTPRWRAVFWTLQAELDADEANKTANSKGLSPVLPWIDAKFTVKTRVHGKPTDVKKIDRYTPYEDYGLKVAARGFMTLSELSHYKYQFDIGGGGGTTFSGTIEKLAMPGVLFHHITSTKDYYHDDLVPWMHYIPVEEGLSDLREMYEWAVANTEQSMRISEAGSQYVRSWANPKVIEQIYNKYFVESLRRVVNAYQSSGEDVGEIMKERKWTLIAKGSGKDLRLMYTKDTD